MTSENTWAERTWFGTHSLHEEKCRLSSAAEEIVIDWVNLNPLPALRGYKVASERNHRGFQADTPAYDPSEDQRRAEKEPEAAIKEGNERRLSVENEAGLARAERAKTRQQSLR